MSMLDRAGTLQTRCGPLSEINVRRPVMAVTSAANFNGEHGVA